VLERWLVDQQITDSEAHKKAREDLSAARASKARALWHLALERITMGMIPSNVSFHLPAQISFSLAMAAAALFFRYGGVDKMDGRGCCSAT
jgi:hypothetical protein